MASSESMACSSEVVRRMGRPSPSPCGFILDVFGAVKMDWDTFIEPVTTTSELPPAVCHSEMEGVGSIGWKVKKAQEEHQMNERPYEEININFIWGNSNEDQDGQR